MLELIDDSGPGMLKRQYVLWRCDVEGCGGEKLFRVGDIRGMRVGVSVSCTNKMYKQCQGTVKSSKLKEFIGYGVAMAYGAQEKKENAEQGQG